MLRRLYIFFLLSCAAFSALYAQSDYDRLAQKAQRFFDYKEWASASAMYHLMLEQKPTQSQTYALAVVANLMNGDTVQALDMIPRAMAFQIPVDTVLTNVRNISFSIGRGKLYEHFLLNFKAKYPWFGRIADNYLMKYYALRQNGPELIRYANIMLKGLPDDRGFLRMLAHGQMLDGMTADALNTWSRVVSLYPTDYETILDIANCYDSLGDAQKALDWMKRADNLKKTPYVTSRIATLEKLFASPVKKK